MGNYLWSSAEPIKTATDADGANKASPATSPPTETTPLNAAKPETNSLADAIVDRPGESKTDAEGDSSAGPPATTSSTSTTTAKDK